MTVQGSKFPLANGGIFSVTLKRITPIFWYRFNEGESAVEASPISPNVTRIIRWFIPKGEITFFKKPSEFLSISIKTDKDLYAPGDKVTFEVACLNRSTGEALSDCYVSVTATDDSVYQQLSEMK